MFGIMKLLIDCFKRADDPNTQEGRREVIRRAMLARISDDLAIEEITPQHQHGLRNKILDTIRLAKAIESYESVQGHLGNTENLAYQHCYDILAHWRR